MSHNTPRTNARTTSRAVFHSAPGSENTLSKTFPENSLVCVRFRPSGEFDLWITVENPGSKDLQFVRRDVPRSAFELIDSAVNEDA
ncbi:hypothetical protein [Glutamicibacter nicotianae]|uniref:hypothetical protein n=1 Tax=Glutamicibacter nicotianae TaxID=37929 RepID=UPI000EF8A93C|nr:hypothetical protein [Glutamicibacter nicotianae]